MNNTTLFRQKTNDDLNNGFRVNAESALLFFAFMLIQLITLRLGNQAGWGYLSSGNQELVYFFIQVIVIAGILLHVFFHRAFGGRRAYLGSICAALGGCAAGSMIMLFAGNGSLSYLVFSGMTVLFLGYICGAVYFRMAYLVSYTAPAVDCAGGTGRYPGQEACTSRAVDCAGGTGRCPGQGAYTAPAVECTPQKDSLGGNIGGDRAGACVGIGYASAIALQYIFQLKWTIKPVLAVLLAASFAALAYTMVHRRQTGDGRSVSSRQQSSGRSVSSRQAAYEGSVPSNGLLDSPLPETYVCSAPRTKMICSVVITLAMLTFITYYNSYIHHLQIISGYSDYNVYSWPRLLMIPAMLLFGIVGDIRGGKYLPISALCVAVVALLNTALLGSETYLLNMCLYYISLTAVIAYYHLTFLRLAPRTGQPALWAPMGRLLDSLFVIISFGLGFSRFSLPAVLAIDIAALAVTIVMMAINGDFILGAAEEKNAVPAATFEGDDPESADPLAAAASGVTGPLAAAASGVSDPFSGIDPETNTPYPAAETYPGSSYFDENIDESDPFHVIQEKYGISPSEMRVLRELVLTDDKQEVMAARLNISVSTLRHHVTSIYKKTGTQTRSALCKLQFMPTR